MHEPSRVPQTPLFSPLWSSCLDGRPRVIIASMNRNPSCDLQGRGHHSTRTGRTRFFVSALVLLLLTLGMFGDLFFAARDTVLSELGTDLSSQFIPWREFGFRELRNGNLALWNPHVFAGAPYLGGFQSALLYPPNLLHLLLPTGTAINLLIALHIFLGGLFMFLWTSHRRLHPLACLTSAGIFMFSGAQFLHIYAGHLPNLYSMAWAPLLFLAMDGFFRNRSLGWCLLGVLAVSMQILAGHPQYVFYTAVAAALYSGLCMVRAQGRLILAGGLMAMFAGAAALTSVQLLTGMEAAGQSVRSVGVTFDFASMLSFPPENFITFLAPGFFGDMVHFPYWGRGCLWEMSVFMGTAGFVLVLYGAVCGERRLRRFSLPMALLLLFLALGAHTPLFKVLFDWVPGFDKFRGNSKFIFQALLFLAMLAGLGLHQLVTSRKRLTALTVAVVTASLLLGLSALVLYETAAANPPADWWRDVMIRILATEETAAPPMSYSNIDSVREAGAFAVQGILIASGTLLFLALLLLGTRYSTRMAYMVVILALAEVFTFARLSRATFDLSKISLTDLSRFLEERTGDYRILNLAGHNDAMMLGAHDLWGHDPGVPLRYARFIAFTQGIDPDRAKQDVLFRKIHPLFSMLRCRFVFVSQGDRIKTMENKNILPRLQLIQDYRVIKERNEILAAMAGDFDPSKTVILESEPEPAPAYSGAGGTARIVDASTDHMTVEAVLPSPSLLLVTDTYDTGWRIRPLTGSDQDRYSILPANYTLRAIPLSEGFHRFRMEYRPRGFVMGKWISLASLAVYTGLFGFWLRKRRRHNRD